MADNREFYEKIRREVKIVDYAAEIGKTVVKIGHYYSLKENNSIRIDPERNCYWRNSNGRTGSVIDFAMEFPGGYSMHEVISMFSRRINWTNNNTVKVKPVKKMDNKILKLPKANKDMHRVFAYLMKTRCISKEIIQTLIDNKQLYEDERHNCVFVSYDNDKPVFACMRGTNTSHPFYGDVKGCDYTKCFFIDNGAEELIVTESVIDGLSVMTMKADYNKYDYLFLAGVNKWESVETYLKRKTYKRVIIATDNDKGGIEGARNICCYIRMNYESIERKWELPPLEQGKDWNRFLQNKRGR